MKCFAIVAAVLLCSNASAATYVYQQNPNQEHGGKCGGALLPFQLMVTVHKALPANSPANPQAMSRGMSKLNDYANAIADSTGGPAPDRYLDTYAPDGTISYSEAPLQ